MFNHFKLLKLNVKIIYTNEHKKKRAGNGTRTRDFNLGKVALYQLSYSRKRYKNNFIIIVIQVLKLVLF